MTIGENLSIVSQAAKVKARRISKSLRRTSPSRVVSARSAPEKLILAPQDLRTPDPTAAIDIYSGRFFLAGKLIDCTNTDPFLLTDAPMGWLKELHNFSWLRHLEAANSELTRKNAHALIQDWLGHHSKPNRSIAWDEEIAARRLISWLCHSVPIVETATPRFYQTWLKSIGTHIRFLKYRAGETSSGMPKLVVRIALAYANICVSGQTSYLKRASVLLDQELDIQIFPDGGHISRNPSRIAEILALLLPLRQSYARLGIAPSQTLVSSIDRMMAALKFYQMGDGNLARFNGVTSPRPELLATVLFYDDSMGKAHESAEHSGYQRLTMGDTIVIADTGTPPKSENSQTAHAGTLSFELSSGSNLIVVNCGSTLSHHSEYVTLSRSTAAHSTATINDTSSSRFYSGKKFRNLLSNRIIAAPSIVSCHRENHSDLKKFTASHNGYLAKFGILHTRELSLKNNGERMEGIDYFLGANGEPVKSGNSADFSIRFHLHPSVSAGKSKDGNSIVLMCGKGLIWKLSCIDCPPELEDSIFFAATAGPKRCRQIVLSGDAAQQSEIRWIMARQTDLG